MTTPTVEFCRDEQARAASEWLETGERGPQLGMYDWFTEELFLEGAFARVEANNAR